MLALLLALTGCKREDPDWDRRVDWIHRHTAENKAFVREVLTRGSADYQFYDGWFAAENDPKSGGAWRWMERRGIVRLKTILPGKTAATDMELVVFGWVPHEHVGLRVIQMEFAVNGHVLTRFDPPPKSFELPIRVPRWLLGDEEWADLTITVTNTARPKGDWRDIGFATTGFQWKPVEGS